MTCTRNEPGHLRATKAGPMPCLDCGSPPPSVITSTSAAVLALLQDAIDEAVAKQKERDAKVAQFWGECECGSAETPLAIADAIRKVE